MMIGWSAGKGGQELFIAHYEDNRVSYTIVSTYAIPNSGYF